MSDKYTVITSDAHAGADLRDYKSYLPSTWHDEFDDWATTYVSPFDDLVIATAYRNWDSDFRLKEMDEDGVAAEILFPNTIPPFFPTTPNITISLPKTAHELERRWAGVQAHNRWQVDFIAQAPNRRRGLVQIFPNDLEAAIAEIHWAAAQGVFGGIMIPGVSPGDNNTAPYFHTRYEPLWAVAEELAMPIVHHGGTGSPEMPMDQPASNAVLITEMATWTQRTLGHLILAGVFERYPNLKFVPTELGSHWMQGVLASLDAMVPSLQSGSGNRTYGVFGGSSVDELTLKPSEYIQRNVYLGASMLSPHEREIVDFLGVDHVMWGSDYPHEEGTAPESKLAIRWALHDRPETDVRKILGENIAGLYGFDLAALRPVADKIGPTPEEIAQPIGDTGYTAPASFGRRPFEGGLAYKRLAPVDQKMSSHV